MAKSVLFVSIAFPPKADSEGLQAAKYFKYLKRNAGPRYVFDVVTSASPTLNMPVDPTLLPFAEGARQTLRLPLFESRYTNYLFRYVAPCLVSSPDSRCTFHWQAALVPLLLKNHPDIIYSRSFPISSAVMALKLKRRFKCPWVMHLSDPWADNPHMAWVGRGRRINEELEGRCIETADVVCLTSAKTVQLYEEKYAHLGKRFFLAPNVYDPEDVSETAAARPPRAKLQFAYTGGLAGARSCRQLLSAFRDLPREVKTVINLVLAGDVDRANRKVLDEFSEDYVEFRGRVSYSEALEIQRSADVLILIDTPVADPRLRVFFPSKLLDYSITGKPIIALTESDSECARAVCPPGKSFGASSTDELREHVVEMVSRWQGGAQLPTPVPIVDSNFSANIQAGKLLELLDELTCSYRGAD